MLACDLSTHSITVYEESGWNRFRFRSQTCPISEFSERFKEFLRMTALIDSSDSALFSNSSANRLRV